MTLENIRVRTKNELKGYWSRTLSEDVPALLLVAKAAELYCAECDVPVPDLALRKLRRDELRAALVPVLKEENDGDVAQADEEPA